jgi:Tfp pilus assembly protein FimV
VIAHTLPGSPLKIELLRQAFVTLNPQAIAPGKVPKLRKGMVLVVPDHGELLRSYLGSRETAVDPAPPVARFTPSTSEERKRWVQFP